jgi:hypothetical protein
MSDPPKPRSTRSVDLLNLAYSQSAMPAVTSVSSNQPEDTCDEIALKELVHFAQQALLYIDKSYQDIMGHKVSHETGRLIA